MVSQLHQADMVALVNQTSQIEELVQNHTEWKQLYTSLRQIKDQHIDPLEYNVQRASNDAKKYIDSIQNGRRDEYENVIRRLHLNAKLIKDETEVQQQKLQDFVSGNLAGDAQHLIPAQDLLFLNLEVTRLKNSITAVQSVKTAVIDNVNTIDAGLKQKNNAPGVTAEELYFLKSSLRTLDKQLSVEIPRIKENLDALEAFASKGLKNKLQDDNKRSQSQISLVKKNFEDLKQEIENLKAKLARVKADASKLKTTFDGDDKEKDLERENEVKIRVDDTLADCDRDINGQSFEGGIGGEGNRPRVPSLAARKKDIVAAINRMVNMFNETSKQTKENRANMRSGKEMTSLIDKSNDIKE